VPAGSVGVAGRTAAEIERETARLDEWFEARFEEQLDFSPIQKTLRRIAEVLAKEMGAYRDPYSDFGRLTSEIWRAIRLVVDTGLHAKRWTEEEAVEYLKANSAIAEGQIRAEIRRYIVMPGRSRSCERAPRRRSATRSTYASITTSSSAAARCR
jgi:hypothetical protein